MQGMKVERLGRVRLVMNDRSVPEFHRGEARQRKMKRWVEL